MAAQSMMRTRRRRTGVPIAMALALLLVAALTGCGSSGGDSGGTGTTSAAYLQRIDARLDALYKGTYSEPRGPTVAPKSGENLWVISPGESIEAAHDLSVAVQQAGSQLGWDVTVFDAKGDPSRSTPGIKQALADKADGIIAPYTDCPTIKTGLQAAKSAGVPVVGVEGSDCNELQKGDPQLFSWVVTYNDDNTPFRSWVHEWAQVQSTWLIAKTRGKADVVLGTETDSSTTLLDAAAVTEQLKTCGGCSVHPLSFVVGDLGPALNNKIKEALIKYPDANSFVAPYDAVLTLGGATALKASGRDLQVVGGEGSAPGIQQIREGLMDAATGIPTPWEGYAAMDALIRMFAGRKPSEATTGMGVQAVDATHNLPPEGKSYQPPIDFQAAYRGLWGLN